MSYLSKLKNVKDFIFNIFATLIFIGTMQFLVYPQISKVATAEEYGLFLTIIGVINTLGGTFGNSLNNVRLIMNEDYYHVGDTGDFNLLLLVSLLLSGLILVGGLIFLGGDILETICIIVLALFLIIRNYLSVAYRLKINYYHVFMLNVILALSYIIMTGWYAYISKKFSYWYLIFVVGEIMALFYLLKTTDLWREPLRRTKLFTSTMRKYINLIYLSFIGSVLLYFDRNLLLPLMGGKAVATYFAATVIGKALGMFANPISSVILSYLGQVGFQMSRQLFWKINGAISIIALSMYGVTMLIVDWAVQFLYPSLYVVAKPYFWIANLVPIFTIIGDLARPTVLRYVALEKLSIFNTGFLFFTCVVSYCSISLYGLDGFCYGAVGLALFRLVIMWWLGDYAVRRL